MTDLKSISGIGKTSLELLEAAGILDARTLANAGLEELAAELERANRILRIAKRPPRKAEIEKWILTAREDLGFEPLTAPPATSDTPPYAAKDPLPGTMPVNYEATESVREMLAAAPLAIPLPARQLIDAGVAVSEIPSAILLNRYAGDLEIRVIDRKGPRGIPRAPKLTKSRAASGTYVQLSDPTPSRRQIDPTRLRSITNLEPAQTRVPAARTAPIASGGEAITTSPETDRVALLRAPLAATNRGRNPQSRRYIRGVLHSHPGSMMFGALVTLVMMVLTVPALVAAALLLLSDLYPQVFHWVSPRLLMLPCALPVVGVLYLIYAVKGKCRICNQRLFFRRSCRKNSKAHRIPGLGYIVSVSIHMLLFRWFRCTYCGTPVRLKK
ncbi:MAG: DUF4332 domain-containing protein [Akkermansiaceae bacterium]|nr:DUF4332 domain-containing protein [Akkermansiaceae bacterium]